MEWVGNSPVSGSMSNASNAPARRLIHPVLAPSESNTIPVTSPMKPPERHETAPQQDRKAPSRNSSASRRSHPPASVCQPGRDQAGAGRIGVDVSRSAIGRYAVRLAESDALHSHGTGSTLVIVIDGNSEQSALIRTTASPRAVLSAIGSIAAHGNDDSTAGT